MSDFAATKAGLRLAVRSLAGLPYRSQIHRSWSMSDKDFWSYQTEAFRKIYNFTLTNVPYYREHRELYPPIPEGEFDLLTFLQTVPTLSKQTFRDYNVDFFAQPLPPLTTFHRTSGTTGTPLKLAGTITERGFSQAILEEWYRQIIGCRRPKSIFLSGFMTPDETDKELFWVDRINGDIYLSIYSLTSANRGAITQLLNMHKPQLIYGYASAVHELALLLREEPNNSRSQCVAVVTSEVLYPNWKADIEATLSRRVFNLYGSQEGNHQVMGCEQGSLHINPLVGVVEIVDDHNQPAAPHRYGRVLITGLFHKSMPLVRYDIGDIAESTGYSSSCSCGLSWPTIGSVSGRSEDLVRTRDGRRVGYLCFHATKNLEGIHEAQIIQTDYDRFVCNIALSDDGFHNKDLIERKIQSEIERRLQEQIRVDFRYLDSISRGARGKFKAVIVNFESD